MKKGDKHFSQLIIQGHHVFYIYIYQYERRINMIDNAKFFTTLSERAYKCLCKVLQKAAGATGCVARNHTCGPNAHKGMRL